MNFLAALAQAGPAAFQGYNNQSKAIEQHHQEELARQAGGGYGAMLRAMAASSGLPQLSQLPGSYPQSPPPGQPPQSYGNDAVPPGTPQNQNVVPFPRPKPFMPGMTSPQPKPMSPPAMEGQVIPPGQPGPMPNAQPDVPPQGASPLQFMSLQQIVNGIKQSNPNISDEALGMAVDRFLPMMNAQAQMQYHMLMMQGRDADRAIRQQNADTHARSVDNNMSYRDSRLRQMDADLARKERSFYQGTADRDRRMHADQLRLAVQQAGSNYRSAEYAASAAPDNQQLEDAKNQAWDRLRDAQQEYDRFITPPQVGGYVNGLPTPASTTAPPAQPTAAPAKPKPAGPPPPPGFTETPQRQSMNSQPPSGMGGPEESGPHDGSPEELLSPPAAPSPAQAPQGRFSNVQPRPRPAHFASVPGANVPEGEDPSRVPGMYGYDAQGRELSAPTPGQGGYTVEPQSAVTERYPNGRAKITEEAPQPGVVESLPQGRGPTGQNLPRQDNSTSPEVAGAQDIDKVYAQYKADLAKGRAGRVQSNQSMRNSRGALGSNLQQSDQEANRASVVRNLADLALNAPSGSPRRSELMKLLDEQWANANYEEKLQIMTLHLLDAGRNAGGNVVSALQNAARGPKPKAQDTNSVAAR